VRSLFFAKLESLNEITPGRFENSDGDDPAEGEQRRDERHRLKFAGVSSRHGDHAEQYINHQADDFCGEPRVPERQLPDEQGKQDTAEQEQRIDDMRCNPDQSISGKGRAVHHPDPAQHEAGDADQGKADVYVFE